jgi:hypothetical protein
MVATKVGEMVGWWAERKAGHWDNLTVDRWVARKEPLPVGTTEEHLAELSAAPMVLMMAACLVCCLAERKALPMVRWMAVLMAAMLDLPPLAAAAVVQSLISEEQCAISNREHRRQKFLPVLTVHTMGRIRHSTPQSGSSRSANQSKDKDCY